MQRVVQSQTQFDLSKYLNSDGRIRWVIVNQEYLRGTICNEELIEIYRKWRDQDEYAVLGTAIVSLVCQICTTYCIIG